MVFAYKCLILILVAVGTGLLVWIGFSAIGELIKVSKKAKTEPKFFKPIWLKIYEPHSYLLRLLSSLVLLAILTTLTNPFLGIIFGVIGFFLPSLIIRYLKSRRTKQFDQQLLAALEIISRSLRAGRSFLQALETLARQTQPPISQEINEVLREIHLGVSPQQSLNNLAQRIPGRELNLAVNAINIGRETGGDLTKTLDRIVSTMRERNRINEKVSAFTAQGRLSATVVSVLPVILLIVISYISPELIRPLFHTFLGNLCLVLVFVLISLGAFFIHRIVKIEI